LAEGGGVPGIRAIFGSVIIAFLVAPYFAKLIRLFPPVLTASPRRSRAASACGCTPTSPRPSTRNVTRWSAPADVRQVWVVGQVVSEDRATAA
jgi:hypothetical protein